MQKFLLLIAEILNLVLLAFFGISVMSFFAAITPAQAEYSHQLKMPASWEAGVLDHGSYYQWITIAGHPLLFVASLLGLALSFFGIAQFRSRL
jgi:hypothetical protein